MRIYTDKRTCKDRQFYMDILPEVQLVTSSLKSSESKESKEGGGRTRHFLLYCIV